MTIQTQLFEGTTIRLAPIDHEKDAEIESRWTHDLVYLRGLGMEPARPLSPAQVKKKYEAIEKEADESKNLFHFTIRHREENRLLGFARIYWIGWTHGNGNLKLAIGDAQDRNKGYGSETMNLLLHLAFDELNLYRLSATIGEDNPAALHLFHKFGFVEEVRRRKAILRDGRAWDLIHVGLLQDEWRTANPSVER
jgi:RimJ/RimL family protein N-acetyltransferase